MAETRADNHEIRIVQRLGATNILLIVGIDEAFLFIRGKEHHAIEAMRFCQDLGQHWHRLLCAIFLITCHEHNGFTLSYTDGIGGDFEVILSLGNRE